MTISNLDLIELPATADCHVHLRDGKMMETVVPTIRSGGTNTVYVMPNLVPPITTVGRAIDYKAQLQALEPKVNFLMSLYLHPDITPETIIEAKQAGISGVKSYPAGVTTNSAAGVVDYAQFYPIFAEMERQDLVLNLHGECPSQRGINVLNAEEKFLPELHSEFSQCDRLHARFEGGIDVLIQLCLELHSKFPKLRIVLEHCTTKAAIDAVKQCGSNVVATITGKRSLELESPYADSPAAHHLFLTIDDVVGDNHSFCKPVAKTDLDREALLQTAVSGDPKFFLGTDSAPHPKSSKVGDFSKAAAGVFTQPYATQIVIDALETAIEQKTLKPEDVTVSRLENFLSGFGRAFYRAEDPLRERIVLKRGQATVLDILKNEELEVVPFRRGKETWSLEWK
jgi:dihydroorotase